MSTVTTEMLVPADWQLEDLAFLGERDFTANWSDMGCYKTSTALWMTDYKVTDVENPAILVITNRSGKGVFFRDIPKTVGDRYTVFNVNTQNVNVVVNGRELRLGKELADDIQMPHIVITHYHVFMKCNRGKTEVCDMCDGDGKDPIALMAPCRKCEGKGSIPMPLTQGDRLLNHKWDMVICDEAHRMKNKDTKWTSNIKRLKSDHKHLMTGTGFINRPDEIWSLLNFLDKKKFSSYWAFREHYCEVDDWSGWAVVKGCLPHRKNEFRALVREYGPRREKLEVFKNLPEPVYEDINVELNPTQQRMYNEIKNELATLDQQGVPISSPNILSMLNRLRQICVATPKVINEFYDINQQRRVVEIELIEPSSKLDALMDIIEGLRWDDDDRQQIVVFSNFFDPLVMLGERLTKANIPAIHLKAADNDQLRYHKWAEAWPKKEHQVFMSTMQLGGESIDLTSAQYIAFLDQSWSPKDNNQARDRVWRPGQVNTPVVIKFFANGTVDHYVFGKLKEKQGWFDDIFGKDEPDASISD